MATRPQVLGRNGDADPTDAWLRAVVGRSPLARILRRRRTAALVAEHIVAIDVTRVRFPADACVWSVAK